MTGYKDQLLPYTKTQVQKEFAGYVEHPRFGKYPHFTGLNPQPDFKARILLHYASKKNTRIAGTAIEANISRQSYTLYPVTFYYDEKRICLDCHRPFIFFAQEQKHWYETLNFSVDAWCVRCINCRKAAQWIAGKRKKYETLLKKEDRSADETIDLISCWLHLVEEGVFTLKHENVIRKHLKSVKDKHSRHIALMERLQAIKRTVSPSTST